jgi:quaternary ammonium compound-resistance protein SugE
VELLFVAIGGALLGLLARYTTPRRLTTGVVLVPAIGAAAAGVVWVVLTWIGLEWDAGVIWWLTFASAAGTVYAVALLLGRARERGDQTRLSDLSSGRVAA